MTEEEEVEVADRWDPEHPLMVVAMASTIPVPVAGTMADSNSGSPTTLRFYLPPPGLLLT
jgi:hypothetical protein